MAIFSYPPSLSLIPFLSISFFYFYSKSTTMYSLFSSVASLLLSPFNWIVLLLFGAVFLKKRSLKKLSGWLALLLFIIFGNAALYDWYVKKWQPQPAKLVSYSKYSCGIIPGGFASPDENANGYFNSSADRFIQAVKLYKLGQIKNLLITGGNGKADEKTFREAAWVKGEMKIFGIPDSVIFIEDQSNNTADNARNAKRILDSLQLKPPYVLITSAFHMPRASLIFRNAGLQTVPFPCNYTAGRGGFSFSDLLPTPSGLLAWGSYLKEAVGYLWYKIRF